MLQLRFEGYSKDSDEYVVYNGVMFLIHTANVNVLLASDGSKLAHQTLRRWVHNASHFG